MIAEVVLRDHRAVRELWAVARVHVTSAEEGLAPGTEITAVGSLLGAAQVGEALRLEGELTTHPKWGRQLQVNRQESLGIQQESEAHRWLERLAGVGPVMARRIHAAFEGRVLEVLRAAPTPGHPDPLLDVEGIGPVLAKTIRESWGEVGAHGDPEEVAYLDGLGLTRWEVNQVLAAARKAREKPRDFLQTDPYRLIREKGFGFARADNVALRAGVSREAPARVDAAIEFQIEETCAQDTVAPMGKLVDDVVKLTGIRREVVVEGVYRVARAGVGVAMSDEGQGVLVHPVKLLEAERAIYRWATAAATEEPRREAPRAQDGGGAGDPPTEIAEPPVPAWVLEDEGGAGDEPPVDLEPDGREEPSLVGTAAELVEKLNAAMNGSRAARGAPPFTAAELDTDATIDRMLARRPAREASAPPAPRGCVACGGQAQGALCAPCLTARIERQAVACELLELPHFAPADGVCFACRRQIYELVDGSTPIGGCPACGKSYCE